MKETAKKIYLKVMNNRQKMGNWAKKNMMRLAMAAIVIVGVGVADNASAESGNSFAAVSTGTDNYGNVRVNVTGNTDYILKGENGISITTQGGEKNGEIVVVFSGTGTGSNTNVDLSEYVKTSQLEGLANKSELENFASKSELEGLASKSELEGLASKEELNSFASKSELEGLASKEELNGLASKEELEGFASKSELEGLASKSELEGLASKEELNGLASKEELEGFASKSELEGLASKSELEGLASKEELNGLASKEELEGLASKEELNGLASKEELEGFASKSELEGLASKSELEGLASKEELNGLASKEELEGFASKSELEGLATWDELEKSNKAIKALGATLLTAINTGDDDVNSISKIQTNDGDLTITGANSTIAIKGGDANISVVAENNTLNIKMAKNLTSLESISIENGPVLDNKGLTSGTVNIGLKADEKGKTIISGVGDGVEANDAVNKGQLDQVEAKIDNFAKGANEALDNMNNKIASVNDRVTKVGAHAAALAGIHYQPMRPGESQVAASVGHYRGKTAMALGGAYQIDNRLMVQLSGSADGSREFMANAGVSYRFGQHSVRPGQVEAADPKALSLDQAETLAIVKSLNYQNKSQADEIASLKADKAAQAELLAQQGAQIAELAALVKELQAKVN